MCSSAAQVDRTKSGSGPFLKVPRVDALSATAYVGSAMAVVLKRLSTLWLTLALLITVSAPVPAMMAQPDLGVRADTGGAYGGPQPPCTGHMPNCTDHLCCVTISTLPTSPALVAVALDWTSLYYPLTPGTLSGISVKPELSPPILAA